jgi:hypothetical protein
LNVKTGDEKSLFVALPCYGGQMFGLCTGSCLDLQRLCIKQDIGIKFGFILDQSLITRARNMLVDQFLHARTEAGEHFSHMLFVDSDIRFHAGDVLKLLELDRDVIGAPCVKRRINWALIKQVVQRHPDIPAEALAEVTGDFAFNPIEKTTPSILTEPLEVSELGTGHMMIRREVFERMARQYPELEFELHDNNGGLTRRLFAFFDCRIDRRREITVVETGEQKEFGGTNMYVSEDWNFCRMWRAMGGRIFACPWMRTEHIGPYRFASNFATAFVAQQGIALGELAPKS